MDFKNSLSLNGTDVLTATTGYTRTHLSTSGQSSVHWGNLTSTPTTLAGYGIAATDVTAQALTGYVDGTNAALTTTDTILAAFGKVQAQLNAKQASGAYLTGNQTITASGDATGSGTTTLALTLASSGVAAGTYRSVTVDAKGRVTAGTTPTTLSGYAISDAAPLTHTTNTSNPHSVTAAQVGALALTGGTLSGNIEFSNGRKGLVGLYDAAQTQAIFAMGPAYVLTNGGASTVYGSFYGLAWSYDPNYGTVGTNPQSKTGLLHQLLVMNNGVTLTAIGSGIWTVGSVVAGGSITTGGNTVLSTGNVGTYALALSTYYQASTWIQFNTANGLYWPGQCGTHIYPSATTYGAFTMTGSKGGWAGVSFNSPENGVITLMCSISGGTSGMHNQTYGWQIRWAVGTLYVGKGTYGGSEVAVLDASNYSSYALPLSGGSLSGDITTYRAASPTTGVIYLGNNAGTRYLYYDGANYQLAGTQLDVNGSRVLHAANYSSYALPLTGGATTGPVGIRVGAWTSAGLQVRGPGTTASTYGLIVTNSAGTNGFWINDAGTAYVRNSPVTFSDARLKAAIEPLTGALAIVCAIPARQWRWKDDLNGLTRYGPIAQETELVAPELVVEGSPGPGEKLIPGERPLLSLRGDSLLGLVHGAIHELAARVAALETA